MAKTEIGIMTFHAAHNYGSVFQAYATQEIIKKLGFSCEIINYRLENQLQYYNHLYSTKFGWKETIFRLMCLPEHKKRIKRGEEFENFIKSNLSLSPNEYRNYEDLKDGDLNYKILISGSDQIWNIHCTAEFKTEPPESILGYFLNFGRQEALRISFSSSIGGMSKEELLSFAPYLEKYNAISVREADTAKVLSDILGISVVNTLDPTLMLNADQWNQVASNYKSKEKYIFVYTLRKQHHAIGLMKNVLHFAKREGLKVLCVAPFSSIHLHGIEYHPECSPEEFLAYIREATLVITDSFHGTAFSINYERPFYMIQMGADQRKELLLNKLALGKRILHSVDEINEIEEYGCNFTESQTLLNLERDKTLKFLSEALAEKGKVEK